MKTKLAVVDVPDTLGAELRALFSKVASSPRQRLGHFPLPASAIGKKPLFGLVKHDWRQVAVRYLRRYGRKINPNIWIYRGGRHIAVHASQPTAFYQSEVGVHAGEAGYCLGRIIETK